MSLDEERGRSIPLKLKPHECLIRLCLICGERMVPHYEYDTEYRWYHFKCNNCNTLVSLGEMINLDYREDESSEYKLEPLSKEEIEYFEEIEKKKSRSD